MSRCKRHRQSAGRTPPRWRISLPWRCVFRRLGAFQQLRMMTTVIRNIVEGQAWNQAQQQAGVFGSLLADQEISR